MYLLRAKQLGFTLEELAQVDEGIIFDLITEMGNDEAAAHGEYRQTAQQADFDRF